MRRNLLMGAAIVLFVFCGSCDSGTISTKEDGAVLDADGSADSPDAGDTVPDTFPDGDGAEPVEDGDDGTPVSDGDGDAASLDGDESEIADGDAGAGDPSGDETPGADGGDPAVELDAPDLEQPPDNSGQYDPYPQFFWSHVEQAQSYDIQISTEPGFSHAQIIDEDTIEINRYVHDQPLAPGTYYWRARSRGEGGALSRWSGTFTLTINAMTKVVNVADNAGQQAIQDALNTTGPALVQLATNGNYRINETLSLTGKTNVIFDGRGAMITMTDPTQGVLSAGGTHCAIRNLTIDYDPVPHSIGEVEAKTNNTIDVRILPGYPVPTEDHIMNAPQHYGFFIENDPNQKGRLEPRSPRVITYTPVQTLDAANRLYRLPVGGQAATYAQVGYYFLMYGRHNGNPAIRLGGARFVTLDHVVAQTAPAAVIAGGNNDNVALLHSGLRIADGRVWGSDADTVHLYVSRLGPWVEGLISEGCGDDTMNLYSAARYITNKQSDTVMTLSSVDRYQVGDRLALMIFRTGEVFYTNIMAINGNTVTVDAGFTGAPEDAWVYNMNAHNNMAVVRKSRITGGRRYGLFFRVVDGLVADNEFIENSGPAVNLTNDAVWDSHEGLLGQHVKILRNVFSGQNFDGGALAENEAVVEVSVQAYDGSHGTRAQSRSLQDVTVSDNEFIDWQIAGVGLHCISGAVVSDNQFRNTTDRFYLNENYMIDIDNCQDVSGSGNLDMDNRDVTQNLRVQDSDRVSVQIDSVK